MLWLQRSFRPTMRPLFQAGCSARMACKFGVSMTDPPIRQVHPQRQPDVDRGRISQDAAPHLRSAKSPIDQCRRINDYEWLEVHLRGGSRALLSMNALRVDRRSANWIADSCAAVRELKPHLAGAFRPPVRSGGKISSRCTKPRSSRME